MISRNYISIKMPGHISIQGLCAFLVFVFFCGNKVFSQSLNPGVLGTQGNYYTSPAGSVSWTLGEISTETYTSANNSLTQGFQQPGGNRPVAGFMASQTIVCDGSSVSFTDQSTNVPTSWNWSFTGGTPSVSNLQNPMVAYNTPGTYAVSLTVSNATGSDNETINGYITVNTCSSTPAEALSFDGTDDFVSGTNSSLPQLIAGRSFTAWIKPSQVQTTQTIFSYGGTNPNESSTISINGGNLYYSSGSIDVSGTSVCAISPNVWTHVAVTVNNKVVKFYVNGALKFSGTLTISPATSGNSWTISSATAPFAGWMDEVTVWSTAITTQVAATMNTELSAQTGLIGLYHFNQGFAAASNPSVTTATDASTASSTGTLSGFALTGSSSNWVAAGRAGKTKLKDVYCGTTMADLNTQLQADMISSATNYQWEFTDLSNSAVYTYTRGNNQANFYFYMVPQLTFGKTYSVRVRAFVGGVWGSYGAECTITSPSFPTTQLNSVCGTTIPSRYTQLFCTAVPNAQNYEYEFTDVNTSVVFTRQRGNNQSNLYLYMVPQAAVNTTYDVRVRAIVSGSPGTYGSVCQITTPATYARVAGDDFDLVQESEVKAEKDNLSAEQAFSSFQVYPNPNNGQFSLQVPAAEHMVFELYDALGRTVIKEKLSSTTQSYDITTKESGMYYVRITQNNQLLYSTRIVKGN